MPRLSSPLNAKASVRSPYALDRSQQNSCVGTVCHPVVRRTGITPTHALCALMSSQVRPPSFRGSRAKPFNSQCHFTNLAKAGLETCLLTIACHFDKACQALARATGEGWWSQTGSNRRPHACKARALPTELWPLLKPRPLGAGRFALAQGTHKRTCGGPRQTRTADLTLIRRVL